MIKVLWFTGVQLPAVTGQGLKRAGWQEGLRKALGNYFPDIQLGIASYGEKEYQPFTDGNSTYFNILREPGPMTKWDRLIRNWKHLDIRKGELSRCLEIIDFFSPDLVFIFGTENPFGLLADQLAVPVVISMQAIINGYKKYVFHGLPFQDIVSELVSKKFLLGRGVFHKWWNMVQQAKMEKKIFSRCHFFDGRTDWDKKWLCELNPQAKYFHIDRVLGDEYYKQKWSSDRARKKMVYTTSSNASFKGGGTLVKAFQELKMRGRDDIRLRMAGVHPHSRVGKTIQRMIRDYKLHDQVFLLGRIPPAQVTEELLRASVFVLPSHIDNSPNSLAEAMIIGTPSIASNAGGIPSMLENNKEGYIYPHQDTQSLADRIERIIDDRDRAEEFGKKARERAIERHNPQKIAEATVSMYQKVLNDDVY